MVISWAAAASWMLLIFYLSSQTAVESLESSYSFTDRILYIVNILMPGQEIDIAAFDDFIRSVAHFAIYMILGLLIINAFFFQCIYYNTDKERRAAVFERLWRLMLVILSAYRQSVAPHWPSPWPKWQSAPGA